MPCRPLGMPDAGASLVRASHAVQMLRAKEAPFLPLATPAVPAQLSAINIISQSVKEVPTGHVFLNKVLQILQPSIGVFR